MLQKFTEEQISQGKWLFSGDCDFKIGATKISHLPDSDLNEIAFVGLSNVGKSSLINALTGRKSLARTSNTPGRTKQLNFFSLRDKLMLVDLPGYGYAKASKIDISNWTDLMKKYLKGRSQLKRVCLLIDARRGVKKTDIELMDIFDDLGLSYQIILTKIDKIKKSDLDSMIIDIQSKAVMHTAMHPQIIATSSFKNVNIDILRAELTAFST